MATSKRTAFLIPIFGPNITATDITPVFAELRKMASDMTTSSLQRGRNMQDVQTKQSQFLLAAMSGSVRMGEQMRAVPAGTADRVMRESATLMEARKDNPEEVSLVAVEVMLLGGYCVLDPSMPRALGFDELGPVPGSFAAEWQQAHRAEIPYRKLMAYLQGLGMTG